MGKGVLCCEQPLASLPVGLQRRRGGMAQSKNMVLKPQKRKRFTCSPEEGEEITWTFHGYKHASASNMGNSSLLALEKNAEQATQ